ncbi:hypothetical protein D1007_44216 [Hordeum vulgare]|nr:hypothetical protein D1007_44216 [Hordeum vulgare]
MFYLPWSALPASREMGNFLRAVGVRGDAGWENLLHGRGITTRSDRICVSCLSNIRTPVRIRAGGDPVFAGGAKRDSNEVWLALGPTLPPMPFIIGSVVGSIAGNRKMSSRPSDRDEEEVAEFYGQLWVIPSCARRQASFAHLPLLQNLPLGSHLFWISKDLFRSRCFTAEDCYLVIHPGRFDPIPTQFQLECEGIGPGNISFVAAVKKTMEQRGQWQPEKRQAPPKKGSPPPAIRETKVALPAPRPSPSTPGKGVSTTTFGPVVVPSPPTVPARQPVDPRYKDMVCFYCSWPGHYVGNCIEPKNCFNCSGTHNVNNSIASARLQPTTEYFGSAVIRLGFYHIDIPVAAKSNWLNYKNCAILKVLKGEVSASDLITQLNGIFCKGKEGPWQIRELEEKKFLLRFPPWKKVEDLIEFPAVDLPIDGVSVKISEWAGVLDPFGELTEVWIQVEGIPPRWSAWKVFAQFASCLGILVDVGCNGILKSFYEKIRIKVACRDPTKILYERLVEMKKKLYILFFTVEGFEQAREGSEGDDDDPDLDIGDDDKLDDDLDHNGKDSMDDDADEPTNELDKANFSHGKPSGSGNKGEGTCVFATKFHPMMLSDEVHEQFIEETEIKTPCEHVRDFPRTVEMLPLQEDMDICSHMEYCSTQLRRFEMVDSEGEDEVNLQEMECLPENLAATLGSAKRFLIESMHTAETGKKLKGAQINLRSGGLCSLPDQLQDNMGISKSWRKQLLILQKKNLEIPASFQGKSFVTANAELLADQVIKIDLCMGDSSVEQNDIIRDLVLRESLRCLEFANVDPQTILPDNLYTPSRIVDRGSPPRSVGAAIRSEGAADLGSLAQI